MWTTDTEESRDKETTNDVWNLFCVRFFKVFVYFFVLFYTETPNVHTHKKLNENYYPIQVSNFTENHWTKDQQRAPLFTKFT